MIYFHSTQDERYHELNGDRPARKDGTLGLLQDMKEGDEIEVFMESGWIPGWVCCQPTEFKFEVSCISFEDEGKVAAALHRALEPFHHSKNSPIPWSKVTPPSKRVKG